MLECIVSYIVNMLGQAVRLALAVLAATLLNLALFSVDTASLDMFTDTDMGGRFSHLHPALFHFLSSISGLTPYWQSSLQLAAVAVCGTLAAAALFQVLGLRRLLFDPLPLAFKELWAVFMTLALAVPVMHHVPRLGLYQADVILLLPGMLLILLPVMRAASHLLPDLPLLFVGTPGAVHRR